MNYYINLCLFHQTKQLYELNETRKLTSMYNCFSMPYYSRYPVLWAFYHVQMGLGKTLQAISLLSYLKIQHIATGPFRKYPTSDLSFCFCFFLHWIILPCYYLYFDHVRSPLQWSYVL